MDELLKEKQSAQPPAIDSQLGMPSAQEKKQKPWPLIGLMSLLVILFGITNYLAYQNNQLRKEIKAITPEPHPTKAEANSAPGPKQKSSKVSPTPNAINETPSIPTLSIDNWKKVSQKGIYFMIPPDAECYTIKDQENKNDQHCEMIYLAGAKYSPSLRITVEDYEGGSRRKQFCERDFPDLPNYNICTECHAIYKEAWFGNVKALQVAIDVGWCQGGGGAILVVIENKLVSINNLQYNLETKKILRSDFQDTVVSTLNSKD